MGQAPVHRVNHAFVALVFAALVTISSSYSLQSLPASLDTPEYLKGTNITILKATIRYYVYLLKH